MFSFVLGLVLKFWLWVCSVLFVFLCYGGFVEIECGFGFKLIWFSRFVLWFFDLCMVLMFVVVVGAWLCLGFLWIAILCFWVVCFCWFACCLWVTLFVVCGYCAFGVWLDLGFWVWIRFNLLSCGLLWVDFGCFVSGLF